MEILSKCNESPTLQKTFFWENCRCDFGTRGPYVFNKDQFYYGDFFRNCFHGQGSYTWNKSAVYDGGFYSNFKEGYASLSFHDNSYFEGLFVRNKPFGPGVFTYSNGRQDAGFWRGEKLVRLSRAVDFIVPRLAPTTAAKIKLLQFRYLIPLEEEDCDATSFTIKKCEYPFESLSSPYSSLIYDPRSIFFTRQAFEKTYFVNVEDLLKEFDAVEKSEETDEEKYEFDSSKDNPVTHLCRNNDSEEDDLCDKSSFPGEYELGILGYFTKYGTIDGFQKSSDNGKSGNLSLGTLNLESEGENTSDPSRSPKIVSWNRTETCTEMIKQMFRYRSFEGKLSFDVAKLMLGARTAFGKTGYKEKECLHFLKMCSIGPAYVVKDLLCTHKFSEELMDARGNNSLMFAAAGDQHAVIDVLLNYGVDANSFNDEGLTPLNFCLLRRLAQANGIFSWETAFLPKEIDTLPGDTSQLEEWQLQESVESLDRIFGDGMSINDSKTRILNNQYLTAFQTQALNLEFCDLDLQRPLNSSDVSKDLTESNQITLIYLTKSPRSLSLTYCPRDDLNQCNFTGRSITSLELQDTPNASQILGTSDETPKLNTRMIPKSNKTDEFEKSIRKADKDKYLFEISFEKNPKRIENIKEVVSISSKKGFSEPKKELKIEEEKKVEEEEESEFETELTRFEMIQKLAEIDRTIEKLLRQGADPNISEVPKPSIHLAIYTKDLNTVHNLLFYGADPNTRLYPNEGLLTPLHVLVLQKSAREFVDICALLLNLGANPDMETHPEFVLNDEEKQLLDFERGRTPLELLCMRPDVEYADPEGNLVKIGVMLAKNSNTKRFYNGHSCLTLSMHSGNIKLLKALLETSLFDPDEILGKDRGTALHVLVSRELQKKIYFDESVKMCEILIREGANPLKTLTSPPNLYGNCIDFGYREIEIEKQERSQKDGITSGKKESGKGTKASAKSEKEKSGPRDYLRDHAKVVEYLSKVAAAMTRKKDRNGSDSKNIKRRTATKDDDSRGLKEGSKEGRQRFGEKEKASDVKNDQKDKTKKKDVENLQKGQDKKSTRENQNEKTKRNSDDLQEGKDKKREKTGEGQSKKTNQRQEKPPTDERKAEAGEQKSKNPNQRQEKPPTDEGKAEAGEQKSKNPNQRQEKPSTNEGKSGAGEGESKKPKHPPTDEGKQKKEKPSDDNKKQEDNKGQTSNKETNQNPQDSTSSAPDKGSSKHNGSCSESFPEKLRQNLLKKYGHCLNFDINEFLVPYVVLRDGDFYYKFHGEKGSREEQYSLI